MALGYKTRDISQQAGQKGAKATGRGRGENGRGVGARGQLGGVPRKGGGQTTGMSSPLGAGLADQSGTHWQRAQRELGAN